MTPWQFGRYARAVADRRVDDLNYAIHAAFKGAIAGRAKRPDLESLLVTKHPRPSQQAKSADAVRAQVRAMFNDR